jgi:putative superfamily III holin-X
MSEARDAALLTLVRDVVDDMGTLIAGHVRLARAELAADARGLGRRVAVVALGASLLLVGYALACVAAALALAHVFGAPLAFLAVGGVHIVGAGAALGVMARRSTAGPLDESLSQLDRTVASLSAGARDAKHIVEAHAQERNGHNGVA